MFVIELAQKIRTPKNAFSSSLTLNHLTRQPNLGRKVAWPVEEHKNKGKIVALHGKNGLVRSRFRKGMLGKALLTAVEVIR